MVKCKINNGTVQQTELTFFNKKRKKRQKEYKASKQININMEKVHKPNIDIDTQASSDKQT